MEALLADVLLWREGLMGAEECRAEVDRLFLEDPEDELLLELEWGFRDMKGLAARVWRYWGGGGYPGVCGADVQLVEGVAALAPEDGAFLDALLCR